MEREVRAVILRRISAWVGFFQKLGPYVLLEIFVPGGTLLVLLLLLYQRKQLTDGAADMPVVAWALGTLRTVYKRVACWMTPGCGRSV